MSTGVTWSKPRHLLQLTARERRRALGLFQGGLREGGAVTGGRAGADSGDAAMKDIDPPKSESLLVPQLMGQLANPGLHPSIPGCWCARA